MRPGPFPSGGTTPPTTQQPAGVRRCPRNGEPLVTEHPPVRIEQMRIPAEFDHAAQELLGRVAELVRRSRQHVWGISDLTGDAQELYRDLHDPFERVVVLL